jgi:hypothetical protein
MYTASGSKLPWCEKENSSSSVSGGGCMINSNIWGLRPHLLQRSRFCFDEKSGGMPIWWVATETISLHL